MGKAPEYHGDLMHRAGTIYADRDDANYVVAALLAFFVGFLGAHRFYLDDHRIAWFYFTPFAVSAFMGFAMLDFTLLLWEMAIAGFFLTLEIVYFIYKIATR